MTIYSKLSNNGIKGDGKNPPRLLPSVGFKRDDRTGRPNEGGDVRAEIAYRKRSIIHYGQEKRALLCEQNSPLSLEDVWRSGQNVYQHVQ